MSRNLQDSHLQVGSIPQDYEEDQTDIATLNFSLPMRLSMPAKVKKLGCYSYYCPWVYLNR